MAESWNDAIPASRYRAGNPNNSLGNYTDRIDQAVEKLLEAAEEHVTASKKRARYEVKWRRHLDKCLLMLAGKDNPANKSEKSREAWARDQADEEGTTGAKLWEYYKLAEAAEKSAEVYVRALQSALTGLQSNAKTVRGATGFD